MRFGTPCWIDLATTDPKASRDFYGGLFGWQYRANPTGDYLTALADDVPAAGFYRVPDMPDAPAWTLYLAVSDSHRTADRIVRLGGQILMPPQEFDGQGSLLVATDPTGATIGFWEPATPWPFATGTKGEFRWAELNTWDGDAADKFFVDLFGYQLEQIGDGEGFDYTTWTLLGDSEPVAGRMRFGPDFPRRDQTALDDLLRSRTDAGHRRGNSAGRAAWRTSALRTGGLPVRPVVGGRGSRWGRVHVDRLVEPADSARPLGRGTRRRQRRSVRRLKLS
ncbi:VOC family protein [Kibdelosporangium aridum subsp. largum]